MLDDRRTQAPVQAEPNGRRSSGSHTTISSRLNWNLGNSSGILFRCPTEKDSFAPASRCHPSARANSSGKTTERAELAGNGPTYVSPDTALNGPGHFVPPRTVGAAECPLDLPGWSTWPSGTVQGGLSACRLLYLGDCTGRPLSTQCHCRA